MFQYKKLSASALNLQKAALFVSMGSAFAISYKFKKGRSFDRPHFLNPYFLRFDIIIPAAAAANTATAPIATNGALLDVFFAVSASF